MTHKLKRKYLVNDTEFYGIDSIEEFLGLFGKYTNSTDVIKALKEVASIVKNKQDLKTVEEVIVKHTIYNNNGGMYRENGKDYLVHNITTYKMPKDLEKTILNVAANLQSKTTDKNLENETLLSSFIQ